MRTASPLRYPGGKWRIAGFTRRLIELNSISGCRYIEPYAGGASLALSLLFEGTVARICLNDIDPAIFAFWHSLLNQNSKFIDAIDNVDITPEGWRGFRSEYLTLKNKRSFCKDELFRLGFATFFLNRTNRSGIMNAGMIGGKNQEGEWKIDARFNKNELSRRIEKVGHFKNAISIDCSDAVDFMIKVKPKCEDFIYIDPPYYNAGPSLYYNAYHRNDHAKIRDAITTLTSRWMVSYDSVPDIKKLYSNYKCRYLYLSHTAREFRRGKEILFFSADTRIPVRLM